MDKNTLDQINLQNMVFHSHVGVHEQEKADGQRFELDVIFHCQPLKATDTDRLDQTIDYGKAYRQIRELVINARYDLIERLAGAVAEAMLTAFPLACSGTVTVRKPEAPLDGVFDAMAVTITRSRK